MGEAKRKKGGQPNNLNAWKNGKFSKRKDIILTCRTCAAKERCEKYDETQPNQPCAFETIEKPNLSTVENLADFLRHLIELDYLRLRRCYQFECFQGGMLDPDAIKLGQHIRNEIYTLARLTELGELEQRVAALEAKIENRREGLK
jgi:hypothetical protein